MITASPHIERPYRHLSETLAPSANKLPGGRVLVQTLRGDPEQRYFLYLPRSGASRILVTVHGVSRNAEQHARCFTRLAERHGLALVAPLFARDRFRDYQRLGRTGKGPRADLALHRILREVARLTGVDSESFYLFGFSGGGQFAHRYTFAHPQRVRALVVGAAGWYTVPDLQRPYPSGTGEAVGLPGVRFDAAQYLRVPTCVLVGELDTRRDDELRKTRGLDRRQGTNRVQRGRNWIQTMRSAARKRGLATRYRFELLPGVDHSFYAGQATGDLNERVSAFLFPDGGRFSETRGAMPV